MLDYRFALERGGVKYTCPACQQRRFVRYVDTFKGDKVADEVGRCDREDSCGYHLRPSEYFHHTGKNPFEAQKPAKQPQSKQEPVQPSFIDTKIMQASLSRYNENNFCRWLCRVFGEQRAFELTEMYKIGTSKHWQGSCVFWQVDKDGKIRGGKIMLYNGATGRRVKEPFNHIQWVHSVMRLRGYHLQQCLFGEHLLTADQQKPVAIVESEKTAVVAAGFIPEYVWLAIGGKTSRLKEKLQTVRGRRVVLYPDLMAFDEWREVVGRMPGFSVSNTLESCASEADRAGGLDLADYLLRENGLVLSG